jgi:hypothetical protein
MDEMAYPESFNFSEFKNIKSFASKIKYAQQHLLSRVGSGSSRVVFKIDDEKVIKIALNKKGLAQNLEEAEGYKQNYDVLARVFDVDYDDMWIEMELAKKITPSRFKELTGTSPLEVGEWLAYQKGERENYSFSDLEDNDFANELQEFVFDYDYPAPGDFNRISTYGEVIRNGKPTVVVIDFGASKNVVSTHYNRKR